VPPNGDLGSTQILTRHYGAQLQTTSQLTSSGTTPSRMSPQLSPSGLLKHLRMGSVQMLHHIMTTQIRDKNVNPFHLANFSSSLLTPNVTLFFFNIKNTGCRAIIS
jgi:hypothetical protein